MTSDEQVIVLGGDRNNGPTVERRPGRRGSPLWLLVAVLGLFAALIAFVVIPQEEPPTTAAPGGLNAPSEPPSAFVQSTPTTVADAPALALGWREATLVRPGWTVSSVDHGPDGWLAVSGDMPTVAHVSDNAVLWHAHTVHGLVVENAVAAVGEGLMAVFGSSEYAAPAGARAIGAISADRGVTWTTVDHRGLVSVSDVEIVDGRVLVAGSVGTVPGFGWNNDGRAVLWEVVDGELVDLGIAATDRSAANAIVADPSSQIFVLGHTDAGAAVWTPGGSGPVVVTELDEFGSRSFLDVEYVDSGLVALVGVPGGTDGRWLWTSGDGVAWEETGTTDGTMVASIAVGPRGLLGLPPAEGRLWSQVEGQVRSKYPGHETGWERAGLPTDIETDGEVIVMTASGATDGQLFVRGTTVPPVEVVGPLQAGESRWRTVATVDLENEELGAYNHPFGVATDGQSTFVVVPGRLYEVADDVEGLELRPSISGVSNIGAGSSGIWAAVDGPESQLYLYGSDGVWSTQIVPIQVISSVGVVDGALTVAGWGSRGFVGLRMADEGSWVELPTGEDIWWFHITPGGLFGEQEPLLGPEDRAQPVFSTDGRNWEALDGWRPGGAGVGASLFLSRIDTPEIVALADTATGLVEIEVPAGSVPIVAVERWEDTQIVAGVDSLFVRSAGADWVEYPTDLEHGITGQMAIIPGPVLRIAMLTERQLVIAQWG